MRSRHVPHGRASIALRGRAIPMRIASTGVAIVRDIELARPESSVALRQARERARHGNSSELCG